VLAIVVAGRIIDTAAAPGVAQWWRWAVHHATDPRPNPRHDPRGLCCLIACRGRTRV
jgi:hypothetical protein